MFSCDVASGELVCCFSGRMDTAETFRITDEVCEKVNAAGLPAVFELAQVEYISSSFLRLCLKVAKERGYESFRIVGSAEADPRDGRISNESPMGRALIGRQVGEIATYETPDGEKLAFKILSVE